MRGLIGKKSGMTQIFNDGGQASPVTVVEGGPCVVTQVKTHASDGYDAIQVGYGERKAKHSNKSLNGHFEIENKRDIDSVNQIPLIRATAKKQGKNRGFVVFLGRRMKFAIATTA